MRSNAPFSSFTVKAGRLPAATRLLCLASLALGAGVLRAQSPGADTSPSSSDSAQATTPGNPAATTQGPADSQSATQPATQSGIQPGIQPGIAAPGTTSADTGKDAPTQLAADQYIYNPNVIKAGELVAGGPIDALILRAPQASTLNANASSLEYADRHRRSLTLQAEASGTYTSNLYNDFSSGHETSGALTNFALPIGYQHTSAESAFNLYFRGTFSAYPSATGLNHSSQVFAADYVHNTSNRTTWNLSVAGGRLQTVEGYLPAVVSVGSTGVIQSNFSSGLRPLYNAASTFAMTHRWSERNTVILSATAGFMQQPFSEATATTPSVLYRNQTGGLDAQLLRSLDPRRALGIEVTEVYVRGLSPLGHSSFTAVEGTYQQSLRRHFALRLGAGPAYSQSQSPLTATAKNYSYIASGSLDYQTTYAHILGGYRRVLQLGYLATAAPANEYTLVFDRPITHWMNFTFDLRDVRNAANSSTGLSYSTFGLSSRLGFQASQRLVLFLGGQSFNQSQEASGIGRNDVTAGMVYTFGSSLARTGER